MKNSLHKTLPLFLFIVLTMCLLLAPSACADGLQDLVSAVENHAQTFTVTENTTVPEGMRLEAWGTEITVQQGKTLSVQGNMNTDVLHINGTVELIDWGFLYAGQISLGSAGQINITGNNFMKTSYAGSEGLIGDQRIHFGINTQNVLTMEINVSSASEFNSALNQLKAIGPEHFVGDIRVIDSFSLGSGTIDMNTRPVALEVADGKTLTVPTGATLNASVISVYDSTLQVNGTLNANAVVRLEEGGMLKFGSSGRFVSNPGANILLAKPADPNTQITGLDLTRFSQYDRGSQIIIVENSALFAQFKAACQRGDASFNLRDQGVFEIEEDITIPAGMTVDARGTTFDVPAGRHLTIDGTIILNAWNYYGQNEAVIFGTTGRMHITTWSGLAANIWEHWEERGWTNQVDFDGDAGVILLYGGLGSLDNLVGLLDHLPSVVGAHVKADVSIDRAPIDARGTTLTIPVNVNLVVKNVLTIDSLNIDQNENGRGGIRVPMGGELHVAGWIDLSNNIYDELLHDFASPSVDRITYEQDAGLALHRGVFSAGMDYDGLARALSDGENYVAGKTDHLWFFAHVPPDVRIEAWETALTVPEGVELVVEDDANLNTRGLTINGRVRVRDDGFLYAGTITLGDYGELHLIGNNDVKTYYDNSVDLIGSDRVYFGENSRLLLQKNVNSAEEFTSAYRTFENIGQEHYIGEICVHQNIGLSSNIDFNTKPISLEIGENTTMTVPAGKTLKANRINMYNGSKLQVNGTLESNAEIRIGGATLAFAQGSSYVNHPGGYIRVIYTDDPTPNVTGLGELDWHSEGNSFVYVDSAGLFQQLKAACTSQNPPETYNLTNSGEVVISENLTIPAGMTVDARGTTFIVPIGNSVTVSGKLILDRWNLNGQTNSIVIPEGGELHITAWRGLAANIWGGWVDDGSVSRVTFEDDAGIELIFDVRNDEQLRSAYEHGVEAISHSEHLSFNVQVHFAATVPSSVTIPEGGTFILHDTFTVPSGVTLWVDGTLSAAPDVVMAINGTLINNGFVEMEKRESATGAMLRVNGAYTGSGTIGIKDHGDLSGYFHGIDLNDYEAVPDDVGTRFYYRGGKDFAGLKAACERGDEYFDLTYIGEIVIRENLTIPAGMTVDARGTNFVVPVGNTVTIKGTLILDGWNLYGQANSIVIPEGGELHIAAWRGLAVNIWGGWVQDGSAERVTFEDNAGLYLGAEVSNDQHLENVLADFTNAQYNEHVQYEIRVSYPWSVSGSVVIPGHVRMILNDGLTVPANASLTVDGNMTARTDVVMTIDGTLVNNNFVEMERRTTTDAKLCVNGTYSGGGTIGIKDHGDLASYISGIDLDGYSAVEDDVGTRFFYKGGKTFADLKAACAQGDTFFDLRYIGDFVLEENLTIPAGMTVDATGTTFIVPVGKSVTVSGRLILDRWNLNGQPGSIVISEGGNLHIAAWRDLVATIWDSWVSSGWVDDGKVTFGNDAGVYVRIMADDDQSLATALDAQPREHTQYKIHVNYPWSVSGSVVIPGHIRIILENGLTVPAGAVLTVGGNMTAVHDVVMTVNGVLFNNSFIEMESRNTATGAMLRVNGKYSGVGSLGVKDHNNPDGYFSGVDLGTFIRETDDIGNRYFFNREPDLWLPAALNEIGDEAFAGGAFVFPVVPDGTETIGSLAFANCPNLAYVHIPENVTAIDGHAFDGVTGLTIFCYPGSEAESFAQDHGFNCWQAR